MNCPVPVAAPPTDRVAIQGVVVPLVTPVTANGDVDFDGLVELAQWLVAKGVDGLFVAGTTGRFSDFTSEQNAAMCRVVADAVGAKVAIYGGICDSGRHRMLANAARMKAAGADVVVTTGPFYLPRSIEEVEAELLRVAEQSPLPVVFYNLPDLVGYALRAEWLVEMAQHPNVVGYKDSSVDLAHLREVLRRTRDQRFGVLVGKEVLLAEALKAGASGFVVSLAQAEPDLFVALMNHARSEDWDLVQSCQSQVCDIVEEVKDRLETQPVFSTLLRYLETQLRRHQLAVRLLADETPPRRCRPLPSRLAETKQEVA